MGSSYGSNSSSEDEDLILPAVEEIHKGNSELNTGIAKILATEKSRNRLLSLKELCCRFVGQNFPFGVVQLYPSRVPEDVQRRIAFWSFPTDVKKLLDYAKVMGGPTKYEVHFAIKSTVESMMQTGELTVTLLMTRARFASQFIVDASQFIVDASSSWQLLQECISQELSCTTAVTATEAPQERERKKTLEHVSSLIEVASQQQSAHVVSRTGAGMSWPSAWHGWMRALLSSSTPRYQRL